MGSPSCLQLSPVAAKGTDPKEFLVTDALLCLCLDLGWLREVPDQVPYLGKGMAGEGMPCAKSRGIRTMERSCKQDPGKGIKSRGKEK